MPSMYFTLLASLGSLLMIFVLILLYIEHKNFLILISLAAFLVNRLIPYIDVMENDISMIYLLGGGLFIHYHI